LRGFIKYISLVEEAPNNAKRKIWPLGWIIEVFYFAAIYVS